MRAGVLDVQHQAQQLHARPVPAAAAGAQQVGSAGVLRPQGAARWHAQGAGVRQQPWEGLWQQPGACGGFGQQLGGRLTCSSLW